MTQPPRSSVCVGLVCKQTKLCGSIAEPAGVRDAWAIAALGVQAGSCFLQTRAPPAEVGSWTFATNAASQLRGVGHP